MICCRGTAGAAMTAMRQIMDTLRLTVNEQKTRQCRVPDESFDFLGYTIGRCYSPKTGKACIDTRPSRKKITRLCREISEMTSRRWTLLPVEDRAEEINRKLIGWSNYFCLGPVRKAYAAVERHVCRRLRQWLRAKHKVPGRVDCHAAGAARAVGTAADPGVRGNHGIRGKNGKKEVNRGRRENDESWKKGNR